MKDISIENQQQFAYTVQHEKTVAMVVISGTGKILNVHTEDKHSINKQDFALIYAEQRGELIIQANTDTPLRVAVIEVPAQVDYPLYRNR